MALTKIGKEGITGVSNAANATFLTATSAEGVTLAGTLAVTGVHTVGTNAVFTSDGGATTLILRRSVAKFFMSVSNTTVNDSVNLSGITDAGDYLVTTFTANMANTGYSSSGQGSADNFTSSRANAICIANITTSNHRQFALTAADAGYASGSYAHHHSTIHGDLA